MCDPQGSIQEVARVKLDPRLGGVYFQYPPASSMMDPGGKAKPYIGSGQKSSQRKSELRSSLQTKNIEHPELANTEWLLKFYYLVDVTEHLNQLNVKMQGVGNTVFNKQFCIHVNCLFGNNLFDGPIRASLLSTEEMASLKRQFTELLSDIGFVKEGLRAREIEKRALGGDGILEAAREEANSNAENPKLISAMLCAALYPNVVQVKSPEGKFQKTSTGAVRMQPKSEELKFVTKNDGYVHIHPSSVNYQVRHFDSPYLLYHEKIKTSRVFIRNCSMVSVYPLVLFGGGQVNVQLQRGEFVVSLDDGWIRFVAASHQVAELVKELRCELDQLLQDKIKNPSMDLCTCPRGSRIISMIVKLVTTQ
ncbi:putative ATP-dependent RNA helicase DHX57 [Saccopteryx leptura]|uniref:putative ATP-dependent RNA helicase DHX57 n=1 Tax=Saccopteryx leptura TaxID=249018 RepID=UPI00339BA374